MSDDLTELFERDPVKLTDQDIVRIVARMRESQAQFELGLKPAKAEKPKKAKADILKDLGLV